MPFNSIAQFLSWFEDLTKSYESSKVIYVQISYNLIELSLDNSCKTL
jgi:hypothetical protein